MSFFDLSIPYIEKSGAPSIDARSRRDCRLRTVARAMELGYTAVAYDRSFRGVLSDADRCQIAPFPPQSFLESVAGCSPAAFSASVALHRDLLGVPRASPFRQYTRITVSVDSVAAASALNSGNRLLRSYDLVATRPLNQLAFDQACNASEVDIILLDFSQKLPFRLKLAMVQAAIKRGVHFEISYSHIISGGHARRQILSEAKRLAEWTRGKNLIISSSAASLNEIRGPCDVANLSTVLLGLTIERSKAAISGNCRSLVANALRKKDCYFKEAIRIERILLPEEKKDSQADWFIESNDWDPISSGENDLPSPDDMFKLFSAASKHSKSQNAVDFTSSINGMAPNSSIFSTTYKLELDSDDVERHNNVDPVSAENVAAMAAKSETKPCSIENGVAINALANPNPSWAAISISHDLTLKASDQMIDAFIMSDEDVEITDQVDAVSVFAQTASNVNNSLDCSFSDTVSALEEHYLEKMEIQEKILSSGNVQLNGYPDKMGGKEQLAVLFETSISDDDARVKIKQEKQQFSASTIVILPDSSAKLEAQLQKNVCSRRNNSKGFGAKTKGKKKRFAAAEIEEADVFSEEISTSKKNEPSFSLEIHSLLNEMEGQNIERPAEAGGLPDRHVHKSGKQKLRRRSHHRGYLLTARSLCKPLVFKKAGRLRRMRKFL